MFDAMNASDFILSRLDLVAKRIPSVGLRYAYDSVTSFHIIEVYPESVRRGCDEYTEMEYDLWIDFHKQYPEEDLLISEVDSTNDMSRLLYEHVPSVSTKTATTPMKSNESAFSRTVSGWAKEAKRKRIKSAALGLAGG